MSHVLDIFKNYLKNDFNIEIYEFLEFLLSNISLADKFLIYLEKKSDLLALLLLEENFWKFLILIFENDEISDECLAKCIQIISMKPEKISVYINLNNLDNQKYQKIKLLKSLNEATWHTWNITNKLKNEFVLSTDVRIKQAVLETLNYKNKWEFLLNNFDLIKGAIDSKNKHLKQKGKKVFQEILKNLSTNDVERIVGGDFSEYQIKTKFLIISYVLKNFRLDFLFFIPNLILASGNSQLRKISLQIFGNILGNLKSEEEKDKFYFEILNHLSQNPENLKNFFKIFLKQSNTKKDIQHFLEILLENNFFEFKNVFEKNKKLNEFQIFILSKAEIQIHKNKFWLITKNGYRKIPKTNFISALITGNLNLFLVVFEYNFSIELFLIFIHSINEIESDQMFQKICELFFEKLEKLKKNTSINEEIIFEKIETVLKYFKTKLKFNLENQNISKFLEILGEILQNRLKNCEIFEEIYLVLRIFKVYIQKFKILTPENLNVFIFYLQSDWTKIKDISRELILMFDCNYFEKLEFLNSENKNKKQISYIAEINVIIQNKQFQITTEKCICKQQIQVISQKYSDTDDLEFFEYLTKMKFIFYEFTLCNEHIEQQINIMKCIIDVCINTRNYKTTSIECLINILKIYLNLPPDEVFICHLTLSLIKGSLISEHPAILDRYGEALYLLFKFIINSAFIELHIIINLSLDIIINSLNYTSICRRSLSASTAIISLISAENKNHDKIVKLCLNMFLNKIENSETTDEIVNCLNLIGYIYQYTPKLLYNNMIYISIDVAYNHLTSLNWKVRNAASLLFVCLLKRVCINGEDKSQAYKMKTFYNNFSEFCGGSKNRNLFIQNSAASLNQIFRDFPKIEDQIFLILKQKNKSTMIPVLSILNKVKITTTKKLINLFLFNNENDIIEILFNILNTCFCRLILCSISRVCANIAFFSSDAETFIDEFILSINSFNANINYFLLELLSKFDNLNFIKNRTLLKDKLLFTVSNTEKIRENAFFLELCFEILIKCDSKITTTEILNLNFIKFSHLENISFCLNLLKSNSAVKLELLYRLTQRGIINLPFLQEVLKIKDNLENHILYKYLIKNFIYIENFKNYIYTIKFNKNEKDKLNLMKLKFLISKKYIHIEMSSKYRLKFLEFLEDKFLDFNFLLGLEFLLIHEDKTIRDLTTNIFSKNLQTYRLNRHLLKLILECRKDKNYLN